MKLQHCSSPYFAMRTGVGQRITLACAFLLSDLEAASFLSGLSDFGAKVSNPRDHHRMKPCDARLMRCYPVSTRINHVTNDDAECSRPVEVAEIQDRLFS